MNKKYRLKSYLLDCGNSATGTIGFCARVTAPTKTAAVTLLQSVLPTQLAVPIPSEHKDRIEYINVYFGRANLGPHHLSQGG
jgi:hypothetical protein